MKKTLVVMSSIVFASAAVGATPSYYAYAGLGYSNADFNLNSIPNYFEPNPQDDATVMNHRQTDKTALGFKIGVGYRFNDYFAIEASYAYLGKAKANIEGIHETVAIGTETPMTHKDFAGLRASMTAQVMAVDALAIYPVNKHLEIFAKAGAGIGITKTKGNEWDGYYSASGTLGDYESISFSQSKVRFVPKLGLGIEWMVTEKTAIRFEYERLFGLSDQSDYTVDTDYDCVSLGIKYSF